MAVLAADPRTAVNRRRVGDVRAGRGMPCREFADGTYGCERDPLCRHHHRAKQAHGWHLEQPEPGILKWRTPSGRTYATTPTRYTL